MVLIVFLQLPDVVRVEPADPLRRVPAADRQAAIHASERRDAPRDRRAVSAILMALIAIAIWPEFVEMWAHAGLFRRARRVHRALVADQAGDLPQRHALRADLRAQGAAASAQARTDPLPEHEDEL